MFSLALIHWKDPFFSSEIRWIFFFYEKQSSRLKGPLVVKPWNGCQGKVWLLFQRNSSRPRAIPWDDLHGALSQAGLGCGLPKQHHPSFRSLDITLEMRNPRARKRPWVLRQDFVCNSTKLCASKSKKMGWDYLWTESNKFTPLDNGAETSDFPYLLCPCLLPAAPRRGLGAFPLVHISSHLNPDLCKFCLNIRARVCFSLCKL